MTKQQDSITSITLDDEVTQVSRLPKGTGTSFMEDTDFLLLTESEGFDIMMGQAIFRFGGGKDGIWQVEDTGAIQTSLIIVPKEMRGKMHDNEYVGNRVYPTDWTSKLKTTKTDKEVTWEIDNLKYICRPPYWEFKGEHMGVEIDLKATAIYDGVHFRGRQEDLLTKGSTGFGNPFVAEGYIKVKGRTYPIKNALGNHDKIIFTGDLVKHFYDHHITYYWIWGLHPDCKTMLYFVPGQPSFVWININGKDENNGIAEMEVTPLEYWIDPATGVQIPVRERMHVRTDNGSLDITVQAYARMNYGYLSKSGTSLHCAMLCQTNGKFYHKDGRVSPIAEVKTYVEWGRALFPLVSGTT